jgi:GxxExxY protein
MDDAKGGLSKRQESNELDSLTKKIIGCAYSVSNELGAGFLEKAYENAMAFELRNAGLETAQQVPFKVRYKNVIVGDYCADLIVANQVLIEIKSTKAFDKSHMAQCINYLTASGLHLALLINFGNSRVEVRRVAKGL